MEGKRREAGHFNAFLPNGVLAVCVCVWEGGVIVTFSFCLESIFLPTAGRAKAFPSASSWACQPIRHLHDYQQLEK